MNNIIEFPSNEIVFPTKIFNVKNGAQYLYGQSLPISRLTSADKNRIINMFEALKFHNGLGVAACQFGWNKSIVLVVDCDKETDRNVMVLINPEIVWRSIEIDEDVEGCLSLPGRAFIVERNKEIEVVHGLEQEHRIKKAGLTARIIQHEYDHVQGVLISDRSKTELDPAAKHIAL